jgi:glycosyltransferase involved in cell wall biosynthesis
MSRRVLLVSYAFPPVGGAGVQRATKFAKYLPRSGWDVSVLTVSNPSVPLEDKSLIDDIPESTIIRRAKTWEPPYAIKAAVAASGNHRTEAGPLARAARRLPGWIARRVTNFVLQPDPQVLWNVSALGVGMKLLRELHHDVIVASGPPFSSFLLAAKISRRFSIPLVLDYRDEWDLSNTYFENKRIGFLSTAIQRRMQFSVLRRAAAVIATTRTSAAALQSLGARARSPASVQCIYNGYDPDDFLTLNGIATPEGICRITYAGTLWNLTDVTPLVEAVLALSRRRPDLRSRFEICIVGRRTASQENVLSRLATSSCKVLLQPYLAHREVAAMLARSHCLCVFLSDLPGAERVVPAKVFECMAAQRPILVISPRGEVWKLLDGHPLAGLFEPHDIDGIAQWLESLVTGEVNWNPCQYSQWNASVFSRPSQANEMAGLLDAVRAQQQVHTEFGHRGSHAVVRQRAPSENLVNEAKRVAENVPPVEQL